jgi:hypothetical protein
MNLLVIPEDTLTLTPAIPCALGGGAREQLTPDHEWHAQLWVNRVKTTTVQYPSDDKAQGYR